MAADPWVIPAGVVCTKCGYDLRALPRHGVCPECATPTEDALDRVGLSARALSVLPVGVVCITCGHGLCGLPRGGVCPACGTPTVQSLVDEKLPRGDAQELFTGNLCVTCGHDLRGLPPGGTCPECGAASPLTLVPGAVCRTCGYDLRGLPPGGACPECGTTSRQELPAGAVCVKCDYDLRKLPLGGRCPECGTPTRRSPGGDPLSIADPQWLRRLALGQDLLAWGLVLAAASALACASAVLLDAAGARAGAAGLLFVGLSMALGGAFLVTAREPRRGDRDARPTSRPVARLGLVVSLGGVWLSPILLLLTPGALGRSSILLAALWAMALFAAILALLRYLSGLAWRVPDVKLVRQTDNVRRTFAWALPVLAVLAPATWLTVWQMIAGQNMPGVLLCGTGLAFVAVTVALLLLVQAARLLGLMHRYGRAFRRCRDQAAA